MKEEKEVILEIIHQGESLVAQGRTGNALKTLKSIKSRKWRRKFISIESRFNNLKNQLKKAIITQEEYDTRLNRINESLLNTLAEATKAIESTEQSLQIRRWRPVMISLLLVSISIITWRIWQNQKTYTTKSVQSVVFTITGSKKVNSSLYVFTQSNFKGPAFQGVFDNKGVATVSLPDTLVNRNLYLAYEYEKIQKQVKIFLNNMNDTIFLDP